MLLKVECGKESPMKKEKWNENHTKSETDHANNEEPLPDIDKD
jgi:hypothetical protein